MGKLFISRQTLKCVHYALFILGACSMSAGIFLKDYVVYGAVFFVSAVVYAGASMLAARPVYDRGEQDVGGSVILGKIAPAYIALAMASVVLVGMLFVVFKPGEAILSALLYADCIGVFSLSMSICYRFISPVRKMFEFEDRMGMDAAKKLAAGKHHMHEIMDYKLGRDQAIDGMLKDIWKNKEHPGDSIRALEVEMCRRSIDGLKSQMAKPGLRPEASSLLGEELREHEKLLELLKGRV